MKQVIEEIRKNNSFLITSHINLEGDSLGSQLAMKGLLKRLGKKAFIVDSGPVPAHYKFLPESSEVLGRPAAGCRDFDAAIVLDCPTLKRTGEIRKMLSKEMVVINIDHHISNEKFGDVNWVEPNASSAGEMVYKLFKAMGVPLTKEIALCLYIAILTDTRSF